MKSIKILGIFFLIFAVAFGCDMGTEYEGDQEKVMEDRGEDTGLGLGEWDRERTQDFVRTTYSSNKLEVELGNIAKDRATHPDVQEFAQQMVNDHSNANNQLMDIANEMNFNVAEDLIEDHREKLNDFQDTEKDNFDEEYLDLVENLHEDAVDKLEDAADNVTDTQLKNWINTTLPKMKDHKKKVEELNDRINGGVF